MEHERDPEPGFESVLAAAQRGEAAFGDVLRALAEAPILVPSGAEFAGAPEAFRPLLFTSPAGDPMMAVFSAGDRLARYADIAPYAATLSGRRVLEGLRPGCGLVLNAGSRLGMEIPPQDVGKLLAAMPPPPPEPGHSLALERIILDCRLGVQPPSAVLATLARSSVYIASRRPVGDLMSDILPLAVDHHGAECVAVFTRLAYLEVFQEQAPQGVHLPVPEFARVLVPGVGLVVNPGQSWAFFASPDELDTLRPPAS